MPKFGKLFTGPWPYSGHEGVGLHLEGKVTDEAAFIDCLMQHSCHPKASRRILDRMAAQGGVDRLTVMAGLPFEQIAWELKELGVTLTIIAPQPDWEQRFQDGSYPPDFRPRHLDRFH